MKLNKEKFLKSELGGNLQECVTAWDHWLTELRKTGAVLRRLVIIPFNARFTKYLPSGEIDSDYNPYIKYQLVEQSSVEYLIRVGVESVAVHLGMKWQ